MFQVALDFDGTLVVDKSDPLQWAPWALEFLKGAVALGIDVTVHSCRATVHDDRQAAGEADHFWLTGEVPERILTSWKYRTDMLTFLEAAGVLDQVTVWEKPGKPFADYYVDDKAADPDWSRLARELGIDLMAHVERGGAGTGPVGRAEPGVGA